MVNEKEYEKLVKKITELCKLNGIDEQMIDFEAEIDNSLTFLENYNILKEIYNLKDLKDMKEISEGETLKERFEKWEKSRDDGLSLFDNYKPFCIGCIGGRGTGKTALGHNIVDRLRRKYKMPIYVLKYPRIDLLQKRGYKNLKELRKVEHLSKIILWIDEPQISLKKYDKKNNDILNELLSLCRHKDIILVVTTSDTRWINRALESYVDVWFIKDIDYELIKQGSRAKYIIKESTKFDPEAFKLDNNEYLLYYRKDEQYQGKFNFELPYYWDDNYSKPHKCE